MKINMMVALDETDIATAIAEYVSRETNSNVSADAVNLSVEKISADVTVGEAPAAKTKAKKTTKKAAPKPEPVAEEPSVDEVIPDPEPEVEAEAPAAEEVKEEAPAEEAPKPAVKPGSIFDFSSKKAS